MSLYKQISDANRTKYGTEAEKILRIIINQYSDRTHFIYEILQNAEDAGATYVKFHLKKNQLLILHDGRSFNEKDIEGVCGIANGTKEDGTRIGHFGIGFKSVYCYTETPYIYSGKYHFKIKNQLFPEELPKKVDVDPCETCMILPFNKDDVSQHIAFQEISDALIKKINAESILMLNNIEDVKIRIEGHNNFIEINKARHSLDKAYAENVFGLSMYTTITNIPTGKKKEKDADYLMFTDANKEATTIVFKVDGKELKAVPNSKIYAFFPTAKEAHQNFYIHAPFDTTPARDNFKEGAEYGKHNLKLVENICELIWFAFTWMKDNKYLSVAGLNTVFPIYEYEEDDILYGIYENSIRIIQEEIILPTNKPYEFKEINEIYVPFAGMMVEIFDDCDLRDLMRRKNISWLAKEFSTESYAEIRRFLNKNFHLQTLEWKHLVLRLNDMFLRQKSLEWTEKLMARIESYCIKRTSNDTHFIDISKIPFVRTTSGEQICARDENGRLQVYLNNPEIAKYNIEARFCSNETIRSFYQRVLLIPEYNIEQEVLEKILPKYDTRAIRFKTDNPIRENIEDLKIIKDAVYQNPTILCKLEEKYIVTDGEKWYKPSELYIKSEDVRKGYSLVKDSINLKYLSESYFSSATFSLKLDEAFFERIGCNSGIRGVQVSRTDYLKAVRQYQGSKIEAELRRTIFQKTYISKKMDWAFCYEGFPQVFRQMTLKKSLTLAKFLNPNAMHFDIQGEIVGADDQQFSGKNVDSAMTYSMIGLMLCYEKWIYIKGDDQPYSPLEVDKEDILPEYKVAKRLISILPFREEKNALVDWLEANIENKSDIEQIKHILSSPEEIVKVAKVIAKSQAKEEARKEKTKSIKELIEQGDKRQMGDHSQDSKLEISPISAKAKKRREENLEKELVASLDNFTSFAKGLQFTSKQSNVEERKFLEQEYDGHCQICLKQIKKHTGENYFEAINVIKYSKLPEQLENTSKYGWNSLCLCPNCAAEYNYGSKKISMMYDQIMNQEVEPGNDETIDIEIEMPVGRKRCIRYSPRHFMALKEALKLFEKLQ